MQSGTVEPFECEALEHFYGLLAMARKQADMRPVGEAQRRAHFVADRSCELFLAGLDLRLDRAQQGQPFFLAGLAEALECPARGDHGLVDIGAGAEADVADGFLGGGVLHRNGVFLDRVDPLAVDVKIGLVDHAFRSNCWIMTPVGRQAEPERDRKPAFPQGDIGGACGIFDTLRQKSPASVAESVLDLCLAAAESGVGAGEAECRA